MYILFSVADSFLPSQLQGLGLKSLSREGGSHNPAEGMGGIGNQHHPALPVRSLKFHRIGLRQGTDLKLLLPASADCQSLQEGAHPNPQRSLDIALVQLQHQRRFP